MESLLSSVRLLPRAITLFILCKLYQHKLGAGINDAVYSYHSLCKAALLSVGTKPSMIISMLLLSHCSYYTNRCIGLNANY